MCFSVCGRLSIVFKWCDLVNFCSENEGISLRHTSSLPACVSDWPDADLACVCVRLCKLGNTWGCCHQLHNGFNSQHSGTPAGRRSLRPQPISIVFVSESECPTLLTLKECVWVLWLTARWSAPRCCARLVGRFAPRKRRRKRKRKKKEKKEKKEKDIFIKA